MDSLALATLSSAALGVALSPLVLIEMILILFSERRVLNGTVFVIGLAAFASGVLAVGAWGVSSAPSGGSLVTTIVLGILALLLLAVGILNLMKRHDTTIPKALDSISGMGPMATVALASGAILFNPKNLPLLLSAGGALAGFQLPLVAGALVVIVAIAPCLGIILYAVFGGERATSQLDRLRGWLVARNRIIMAVLCLGLGVLLLLKAVAGG